MRNTGMMEAAGASSRDAQINLNGREFVRAFAALIKTASIYDPKNTIFNQPVEAVHKSVSRLFDDNATVTVDVVVDEIYINRNLIKMDMAIFGSYKQLGEDLLSKNLGGFELSANPNMDQWKQFAVLLARFKASTEEGWREANELFSRQGMTWVTFTEKKERLESAEHVADVKSRRTRALRNYTQALSVMREAMTHLEDPDKIDTRQAKRVVHNLVDLSFEDDDDFSFMGLSSIKNHDEYTYNHMVNVCIISIAFGQKLGLKKSHMGELGISALFHDYGKLFIPLRILNKSTKFTDEEWEIMKSHPLLAVRLLYNLKGVSPSSIKRLLVAMQHHINYNATGYPAFRVPQKLHLYSRIVSIADTYDAMTTRRCYQEPFAPDFVLKYLLSEAGRKYDPILIKAFINTLGIWPVGSCVELNTGHIAVVCKTNPRPEHLERPYIKVVRDRSGNMMDPQLRDLSHPSQASLKIMRCVDSEKYNINVPHYLV
ncbi:MAG: hypothetical protein GMKNLPBB_01461 [Myxococcota bacterium]|nr:hypothetical protein [Myxococcota bacterium]